MYRRIGQPMENASREVTMSLHPQRELARRRNPLLCGLIALSAIGCNFDSSGTAPHDFGGRLASISVGGDTTVAVGDTIRLHATGALDGILGMFSYDPLHDAQWATSHAPVATVEGRGVSTEDALQAARAVVRGMQPGFVTVTASARGISGTWRVRVRAP